MPVAIALDSFPSKVSLPNGSVLDEARVLIANSRVLVFVNQGGTAIRYFDEPLVSSSGSSVRGWDLQTESGMVAVNRGAGCGCGNPLRSFNPFPGETRMLVPL
jgi:hypothetical protein